MTQAPFRLFGTLAALGSLFLLLAAAPPAERGRGVVAADHPLVSEAGAEILARGGNAVDAVVAAALAAGVVQPSSSGLGGGGFAVVFLDGQHDVLDFRERAPGAAHADLYRTEDGGVSSTASRSGGLAVAVPGESRGLAELLDAHGSLSRKEVARPAIRLAAKGFEMGRFLETALGKTDHPEVLALFSQGGALPPPETVLTRPRLARTLKAWASAGGDALYSGRSAEAIVAAVSEAGGELTADDLAAYAPVHRDPVVVQWRGYTVLSMPPPSSGGVVLAQMLAVLEGHDLVSLGHNSSAYVHLLAETMKHAYADRAQHLGDPDFVDVPIERLLSSERVGAIRDAFSPEQTYPPEHYGVVTAPPEDAGTAHISVIDPQGNAAALTTTVNLRFGSGVVVEELGLILNDQMDDFAAAPGVPNAFGLVGNAANAIAPGKRPLSSMTPTLVIDANSDVVMSVGASGGSFIISGTLQVLLNVLVFDMDPQEAVAAPRFHHQWIPDHLVLEPGFPLDVHRALEGRGHTLEVWDGFSSVQVVTREGELYTGGSDPRKGGWPAGVWSE